MSSGNPFGLTEISHFGSFQRVGGKAGGFISKKFFHPSSFRNQEKLWKAQQADEQERRKQTELEKRRDEERQVEELKKQMYLAGQGGASDFLSSAAEESIVSQMSASEKSELKLSTAEMKRRKDLLRQQERASKHNDLDGDDRHTVAKRDLAKSRYQEDVLVNGHTTIWGSWYSTDNDRWGFACCKGQEPATTCPLNQEHGAAASLEAQDVQDEPRRKRHRGEASASSGGDAAAAASAGSGSASSATPAGSQGTSVLASGGTAGGQDGRPLMDPRLLEKGMRRRQEAKERDEQLRAQRGKVSGYLSGLMQEPANEGKPE